MADYYVDENGRITSVRSKKKKRTSTVTYSVDYNGKVTKLTDDDDEDIAPVKSTVSEDRTWFQKGAFEDGYQLGDLSKTIYGSVRDVEQDLVQGVVGIGEKVVDAGAYLAGGVGKLLGADGFAGRVQTFIKQDLIDEEKVAKALTGGILTRNFDVEENSVFGDKSDSLVQSAGQLGATIGLQAVGVPWYLTTGATSFGGEVESGFKQGATYGEAGVSAAITAGAEILTEKISGGIKFGGKTLDDGLTKEIARRISDKTVRTLTKLGVDAVGEGSEEVLSGVMSAIGQKLTYADDKQLNELFSSEDALESFIGGAVLGGGMTGINIGKSIKEGKGRDIASGLTDNESAVIDRVYQDRVAEQEKSGKITEKAKRKIYDEVLSDMERGGLSIDTIEEVLGGETYSNYKKLADAEATMQAEYDALGKKEKYTLADDARYKELGERLKYVREKGAKSEMRKRLDDEVSGMVAGSRLSESFAERSRRGQAFEADLAQYDEKQRAIVQKAVDSGILNNTRRTHEFVDMVARIAADRGLSFDFTNNAKLKESGFAVEGKTVNGFVTKDGITVNIQSAKSLNSVVGHEIAHVLEGTELYAELQQAVFQYAETKKDLAGRRDTLTALYNGVEGANIDAELTADLVGDYLFTDADFISNLSTNHRSVFQKIYDEVKYLLKMATAGSKEARQLEQVKHAFEKAYRAGGKTAEKSGTQYSLDPVAAVQPKGDGWHRGASTDEVRAAHPTLYAVDETATEERNPTQVKGTVSSYRKVYSALQAEGFDGTILDASSGLGYGTKAGIEEFGFDVEDIEPYPDKSYHPKHTDYSALDKKYDVIISNAVLNVLPQDQRDALVVKMGALLNEGGRMFINVRGKDVLNASGKIAIDEAGMEYFIPRTAKTGSYQKGFTKPELIAYLQDALGDGFTVTSGSKVFGGSTPTAIVTKKGGVQYSVSQQEQSNTKQTDMSFTPAEIQAIQSVGRKSVNAFTSADIAATEKFARRYWSEMEAKSPFFRSWFGDWRENDQARVTVASKMGDTRTEHVNVDTGWTIRNSAKVHDETQSHNSKINREAVPYLPYLDEIIENAVLLDTAGIGGKKSGNSLLMHYLYAVADIGQGQEVLKLTVEEMYDPGGKGTKKRAYTLQNIEKAFAVRGKVQGVPPSSVTKTANAVRTVADLFSLVKRFDTSFSPKTASKIVNADGTPKVMYHGSNAKFTVFDRSKAKNGLYGKGFYFTDSSSHAGTYGSQYEVYLDIRNPLQDGAATITRDQVRSYLEAIAENEDYSIENYGTYDIDAVLDIVMGKSKSADAFKVIQDINATAVGDMVEAAELFNTVNGTNFDGIVVPTETVAFRPEQIKSATDNIGTFDGNNPDIRFSLSEEIEPTDRLVAVHNKSVRGLQRMLDRGGVPFASIAIKKAGASHEGFGEVSIVFPRSTIDPEGNRWNKLYSNDAWTPTEPHAEYDVGDTYKFKKLFENMLGTDIYNALRGSSYLDSDSLERELGSSGGDVFEAVKRLGVVKYGYLQSIGQRPEMGTKQKTLDGFGRYKNDQLMAVFEALDGETIRNATYDSTEVLQQIADTLNEQFLGQLPNDDSVFKSFKKKPLYTADKINIVAIQDAYEAWEAAGRTVPTEPDTYALENALRDNRELEEDEGYRRWVEDIFDGLIKDSGIPNGRDYYTPSGNRRSFKQLHVPATLENIVQQMRKENETGIGSLGGINLRGAATKTYATVEEMRADSGKLLGTHIDDDVYDGYMDGFHARLNELKLKAAKGDSWSSRDTAEQVLLEAVRDAKTKASMASKLRKEAQWINYDPSLVDELWQLKQDVQNMPAPYFEAKPRRIVTTDEAAAYIVPDNAPASLFSALDERGLKYVTYKAGDEADRLAKLNSVLDEQPDLRFSMSAEGAEQRTYGSYNVRGSDVALETVEDIAPVRQDIATVSQNATVESGAPADDIAPVRADLPAQERAEETAQEVSIYDEYDRLEEQLEEQERRWKELNAAGDYEALSALEAEMFPASQRMTELKNQIDALEAQQAAEEQERLKSFTDEDAPVVREAPYSEPTDPVTLPKKMVQEIARDARKALVFSPRKVAKMRTLVEKFASGEIDSETLRDEIAERFGVITEMQEHEDIAEVRKWLRTTPLRVSKEIQSNFTDYGKSIHRPNRWRILFSNTGAEVDAYYSELSDMFPGFFPGDIIQPADQLQRIVEVAGMDTKTEARYELDEEMLDDVTNEIIRQVNEYHQTLRRKAAEASATAANASLVADAGKYAPVEEGDLGPVRADAAPAAAPAADDDIGPVRPDVSGGGRIAQVLTEEPKVERERRSLWSRFKEGALDKGMVFEDLSLKTGNRALQAKWHFIRNSQSRAQHLMGDGTSGVKALNAIREEVERTGKTKKFYEYLYHLHNVDRMSLEAEAQARMQEIRKRLGEMSDEDIAALARRRIGKRTDAETEAQILDAKEYQKAASVVNKPVFGDAVTADASRRAAEALIAANPEFGQFAQDVYTYTNYLRQMLVDSGVISQDTADLWAKMYPHYVPIRRAGDHGADINVPLDTRRTGINAPVKGATGGSSDILPLFDTMAQRTLQTYRAIAKNSFGVELKNTLGTTIESGEASVDEVIDSIDAHDELLQAGRNGYSPTFTVFEGGERVTFEITEEMYDAMKPTEGMLTTTIKPLNKASNFHRGVLTEYNPVFMITNAIKDAQDILINSQHAAKTYAKLPQAATELARKGKWYAEYMENGGDNNTYFDNETNTFNTEAKGAAKLLGLPPLRWISNANNVIEMLPRLAEYMASREAGRSVEVSMLDAARVTTNFAAGGDWTKWANRNGATFLNASVQGAMQQVRNVREAKMNGLKGWANLAAKFAVAGLPALILNHLMWDDDEEYEELSDYVKQNYYIVAKYDDGKFVRIPKGRTLAVIQDAFEQMENLVTGNDEVDLKAFLDLLTTNLAPNSPIDNNILSPIKGVLTNTTWYGEDLVPTRLQDLPAAEQYDESTDAISKWLGEKLNISPVKINYLLDQYSGGIGDTFLPMLTPEAESGNNTLAGNLLAPLKSKFTADSTMNNQSVSDFYDTKDELTTEAKKSTATDEDVLKLKYINSVNAEMSDLYKQKREIQNSDLPDATKYEQVRGIQRQIVELTRESLDAYESVHISGVYATVADRHYRLNDDGEWAKITDKQLEKQHDVTSGLGIGAAEYWANKAEYDYAYEYPGKYGVARAVGGYDTYKAYNEALNDIAADKDAEGKSISGSRKAKVVSYLNNLDADYYTKIILFKMEYNADDTYNREIIEYLNSRNDISFEEEVTILKELGFTVTADGTVRW